MSLTLKDDHEGAKRGGDEHVNGDGRALGSLT